MKPKRVVQTSEILERITSGFGVEKYQNAKPFMGSGPLWDFCMRTITEPTYMSCIAFANDLGVPPVKSLMTIYDRNMKNADELKVNAQESQWIGSLMGYVFKFILDYQSQKEGNSVNMHGVKTATRFLDGPVCEFTK